MIAFDCHIYAAPFHEQNNHNHCLLSDDVTWHLGCFSLFVSDHFHIFVGDLSSDIETHQLREAFAPFGEMS